jgi:hypothetical protein
MHASYYHRAHACIMVFDVTRKVTYKNLERGYNELQQHCAGVPTLVVANKIDVDYQVWVGVTGLGGGGEGGKGAVGRGGRSREDVGGAAAKTSQMGKGCLVLIFLGDDWTHSAGVAMCH